MTVPPTRKEINDVLERNLTIPLNFWHLRVLIWKDDSAFVGQCLQTGSIATADDFHELRNTLYSLLVEEVDFNTKGEGSLRNLFDTPAPPAIWWRYYDLSLSRTPDFVSGILMLDGSF